MKSVTPLNAFSSITVLGLVFKNGVSRAQSFHRGVVKQGPLVSVAFSDSDSITEEDVCVLPGGIPPRPPSTLPPPGDQHLTLSLGEKLGRGRVGSVHAVTVMGSGADLDLPELVLKVSRRRKSGSMAQEAWFYEELEQLQGISVPRCYGFFQARLQDGAKALTWGSNKYEDEEDEDEEDEDEENEVGELKEEDYGDGSAPVNEKKYVQGLPGKGPVLSILVLERLGGYIPIGEPIDPATEKDVYEIFHDIGRLSIEPLDIRWSNILSVKEDCKQDFLGKVCPNHGRVHRWRVVDFDLCRKLDGTSDFIDGENKSWINRVLMNLPDGYIVEPWV